MGSAFHQLCPRYSGTLTPTAPTAIRLWDTFTFYDRVTNIRGIRLDSAGIARILSRMHHDLQEFIEKYCTDVRNQLRIS